MRLPNTHDRYGMLSNWVVFCIIIGSMVAACFGIIGAVALMESASCTQTGQETNHETEWRFLSGCYIRTNQGWIPLDQWRTINNG